MENTAEIFTYIASKVTSSASFSEILQKQQNTYDIQPYKIENSEGEAMLQLYVNINNR